MSGSSPNWPLGYVATNTEWNSWWARKQDAAALAGYLPLAGGTMTGEITLSRDPLTALQVATKQYVDNSQAAAAAAAAAAALRVNVRLMGATGDGSTNDTAAIQNAVTAAGSSGVVIFPSGTYKTTAAITVPPGVSILGLGPSSIIAPATASQRVFSFVNGSVTDNIALISGIQIAPTAASCVGIYGVLVNGLTIQNCTFTGCSGGSISLDRCGYYSISHCYVQSSMARIGGRIFCQSSTWNSISGGVTGGSGSISYVQFNPMTGSPYGCDDPNIYLVSQPTTHVDHCKLAWGSYGAGPASFIVLENQCQGNIISDNVCLGVFTGITLRPGSMANCVMPAYVIIRNNEIDSFGGIGIHIAGTVSLPSLLLTIEGNIVTEPQGRCTAAAVSAGGSGYVVGDVLLGPTVPAGEEGAQVILTVSSVSAGVITGVSIYNGGLTQTPPSNPVAFTGGSGAAATFSLTYSTPTGAIWLSYVRNSTINGNSILTYGGHKVGFGIVMDGLTNGIISGNQINNLGEALFATATANADLLITNNIFVDNLVADFGGPVPTFSIVQDNIGIPWLTTTPAMPASTVVVTNTAPYPQQVFIVGGTVTGITYETTPITITTASPIILTIQPQYTISITYSVAPSWVWVPMP